MDLRLYNTLTRKKERFEPVKAGEAGIYACGPTVYNYAHIGNMRTYVVEDALKRSMSFLGYRVRHAMNVTDVGHLVSDADEGADKMELSARREGKSAWEIAKFYTEAFFSDFRALNCLMPDVVCKATDHIQEMLSLIKKLEEKGFSYRISDGIYFDTSAFPSYGALAGKGALDGSRAGARVEVRPEKRHPADFALWKFSPAGEKRQMEWDSPWGRGFPGWHIECSAMSMKYLGETFDIHCGGEDHVAIHHTNEIAQAEAATGKKFVNYWIHCAFLITGGSDKMAKSAGNFLTVGALKEKGYDPRAYRYFCFSAHYRKQLEFTWEALAASARSLETLSAIAARLREEAVPGKTAPEPEKEAGCHLKFAEALADDLNLPQALAGLWDSLRDPSLSPREKLEFIQAADSVLGLDLMRAPAEAALSCELTALVREREAARKNRDFKKSDELRRVLLEKGVAVEDTPKGPRWKLVKPEN